MIENDMPECVLTCYSVYGYLQEVKVVKYTKIYRFCPPESQVSNLALTSTMTIYSHI